MDADDLRLDLPGREVHTRERGRWTRRTDLTGVELKLLSALVKGAGRPVERRLLLETVWGSKGDGILPATIDRHVAALRRKLGGFGERIRTVHGVGYAYKSTST